VLPKNQYKLLLLSLQNVQD